LVTVQRGHDPRDAAFVVSGGAGPALAARLGRDLNAKSTVIPPHPGIFSAWGMLAAEPRADFNRTWFAALSAEALSELADRFVALESEAVGYFAKGKDADIRFSRQVEARYRGQEHGVFTASLKDDDFERFTARFHAAHERAYSFRLERSAIEITTLHLAATLNEAVLTLPLLSNEGRSLEAALRGHRDVYFGAALGWVSCAVYERSLLPVREVMAGPLVVEEETATTLVHENQTLVVTDQGILVVRETRPEAV
jgi:N-methylhydantoinase A